MNPQPRFLTIEQVEALHQLQIDQFGGSHGIRDEGLRLSATAQPESGYGDQYFHKDLYEMAKRLASLPTKDHILLVFEPTFQPLSPALFRV